MSENYMKTKLLKTNIGNSLEMIFSEEFKQNLLNALNQLPIDSKTKKCLLFFKYMLEKYDKNISYTFTMRIVKCIEEQLRELLDLSKNTILLKFVNAIMFYFQ